MVAAGIISELYAKREAVERRFAEGMGRGDRYLSVFGRLSGADKFLVMKREGEPSAARTSS